METQNMSNVEGTITVAAERWIAGGFDPAEWELVEYANYYMGKPQQAVIRRKAQ